MDASDLPRPGPRSRPLLRDEAYARIRHHLLTAEFVAAEAEAPALSERALAAHLELGLAPTRSALERLRAEGLIAVTPNRGIRLPEPGTADILDIFEMRVLLEGQVVVRLAGRLSREQDIRLERLVVEQEEAARCGDAESCHRLDLDLHATLAGFHGNAELVRALARLRDRMYRLSRRLHRAYPDRLLRNAAQHRGLVEAVRDGDAALARQRLDAHLDRERRFTLDPDGRLDAPADPIAPEPPRKKRRHR